MESGIYLIEIKDVYYIGSAVNFEKRFNRHIDSLYKNKHHNIILQRAFNKYGIDCLKTSIIEEVEYTKKLILEKEQYYIDKYKKNYGDRCCNLSDASFGDTKTNHPRREEIIEKTRKTISEKISSMTPEERKNKWGMRGSKNGMFGKTHSEEVRKKLREREFSEQTKEKMSLSAIKKFENRPDLKENLSKCAELRTGEKNPFYGKKHSEETKNIIREKNKNNKPTNMIKIEINGKIYESYGEASKDLNIGVTTIRWRCMSNNEKFKDYKIL